MADQRSLWHQFAALIAKRIGTSRPFVVDGRRTYSVIGLLVVVMSLAVFLAGTGCCAAAKIGIDRYQQPSGKFMRALSDKDESYFKSLQGVSLCGNLLKILSLVMAVPGVAGILRPDVLYRLFVRLKLDRRR
jgi:hypothetical protein